MAPCFFKGMVGCCFKISQYFIFLLSAKCQAISIPLCQNLSYTMGQFPNNLKQTQEEAKAWIDANEVTKLIHSGCSPDIGQLLCSILSPPCNAPGTLLPPCKEFCRRATKACKDEIKRYKLKSHPLMRCRRLPKEKTEKCFDGSWQRNTAGESLILGA